MATNRKSLTPDVGVFSPLARKPSVWKPTNPVLSGHCLGTASHPRGWGLSPQGGTSHFRCQSQAQVVLSALLPDQLPYNPLWVQLICLRNSLNALKCLFTLSALSQKYFFSIMHILKVHLGLSV
jgi:hypothetical protein